MPRREDLAFARTVLKRGWLSREALENALRELETLRQHDPDLTLGSLLGVREALTGEQIEWVRNKLLLEGEIEERRPEARAEGRAKAHVETRAEPSPPARDDGPSPVRLTTREQAGRSAPRGPAVFVAGLVFLLICAGVIFILVSRPGEDGDRPPAAAGAKPPARIDKAGAAGPADAERGAGEAWKQLVAEREWYRKQKRYRQYAELMRAFQQSWQNTKAAATADEEIYALETEWQEGCDRAWDGIYDLMAQEKKDAAIAALRDLRSWCPEDQLSIVDTRLSELGAYPGDEVAAGPRKSPWRETIQSAPGERDGGEGAGGAEGEAEGGKGAETASLPPGAEKPEAAPSEDPSEPEVGVEEFAPPNASAVELIRRAQELAAQEKFEPALALAEEALFIDPENVQGRRAHANLSTKVAALKLKGAEEALKSGDNAAAFSQARASFDLIPSSGASSVMKKLGYHRYRSAWRTREEIAVFDREEKDRAAASRARLHLDAAFRSFRTDRFRVFTDLPDEKQWNDWLEPTAKVIENLFEQYRWLFRPLMGGAAAEAGLDLVFFKNEPSYQSYIARNRVMISPTAVGFYSPQERAGFFYRDPIRPFDKRVILHEVTHQLNDLVLGAARVTWLNEGIAQYFEAALVTRKAALVIGRPDFPGLARLRAGGLSETRYLPAELIFKARAVNDAILAGGSIDQIYAQMWGWAYFFLRQSERHRKALLEGLRREQKIIAERQYDTDPHAAYVEIFEKHEFPLSGLDAAFKKFIRQIPMRGKPEKT